MLVLVGGVFKVDKIRVGLINMHRMDYDG